MKKVVSCISIVALCLVSLVCFTSCKQEQEYTVTFYENKGIYFWRPSSSSELRISIHYQDNTIYKVVKTSGEHLSEPTPPSIHGYAFLGWYKNPECTDKFLFGHYEINGDINLYAKWGKTTGWCVVEF